MATFSHIVEVATQQARDNLQRLQQDAADVRREFLRADEATERYGKTAGKVGSNAGRLAGVLDRLSPELAEVARLANDGADALEVSAEASKAASLNLGRLLAVLAPVGVAVGVLAGAYFTLKARVDEANEAMKTAAERSDAAAEAHTRVREQALLAALATGDLSQEEFNRLAAIKTAGELFADQQAQARDRLRTAQEEIRSLQAQREEAQALVDSLKDAKQRREDIFVSGEGGILSGQNLVLTADQLKLAERELANINEKLDAQALAAGNAGRAIGVLDAATERYADDITTVADAAGSATAAVEETTEAVLSLSQALAGVDLTTLGRVTGQDLGGGSSTGPFRLQDLGPQVDAQAAQDAADRAARRQAALGGVSTGLNALANPGAALGLLGPAGGILQALSSIGGLGADGVEQRLDDLLGSITGGIEALPEILAEVIPEFIVALLTELPGVILNLIPNLVRALIDGWRNRGDGDGELSAGAQQAITQQSEVGGGLSPEAQAALQQSEAVRIQREGFGANTSTQRSSQAATTGRIERARGASRLSIARSPTARGAAGGGVAITVNQLGPADATQDAYLRTLARLQDADTGLRG